MRAWADPGWPATDDGPGPQVTLFDRRSGVLEPSRPDGPARLYVCGITPYDATHLGHAATYVAFDLLVRAWRVAGHDVTYVQNITDVDDPLLERAAATGQDWVQLAEREIDLFRADMTALGVIPPDAYIGAVEAIPVIVDLVDRLQRTGATYRVDDDIYFAVHTDPAFGSVSGWDREQMLAVFAERGGDPERAGKQDALDCLLWQAPRPGEPSWPSRLGPGRPGWHVECAAIALEHLGAAIDVQGGGSDLVFPHHEMSASEAQVADPEQVFAKLYVHAGMVGLDGHKMSKSRGNLVLVSTLRQQGVDPRVIRLALLSQHYREDWEWRPDLLAGAAERLDAWTTAVARGGPDPDEVIVALRAAMAADLDAPAALAAVDAWAAADAAPVEGAGARLAAAVEQSLGVRLTG